MNINHKGLIECLPNVMPLLPVVTESLPKRFFKQLIRANLAHLNQIPLCEITKMCASSAL